MAVLCSQLIELLPSAKKLIHAGTFPTWTHVRQVTLKIQSITLYLLSHCITNYSTVTVIGYISLYYSVQLKGQIKESRSPILLLLANASYLPTPS